MDPITCCLLGICCPPASPEQLEAFTTVLQSHLLDQAQAEKVAKAMQKDLAKFTTKLEAAVKKAKGVV